MLVKSLTKTTSNIELIMMINNFREIKTLINEAKNTFDKAFTGVPPDIKTEIPSFLTAELTLTLMQKIMKESLYKIQQFLKNLKEKGIHISYENPQVLMGLQDLRLDEIR